MISKCYYCPDDYSYKEPTPWSVVVSGLLYKEDSNDMMISCRSKGEVVKRILYYETFIMSREEMERAG